MERISTERPQAMLDFANKRAQEEDFIRRLENRVRDLSKKTPGSGGNRSYILEAWGGDLN